MTLKEFDNRIAMYLAEGYNEAIITFDETGIKDIQAIENN
jgi:hypothetical protein